MKLNPLRAALLAVLSTLVLALAACGSSDDSSTGGADLGPDPATMTPADAPVYGDAVVRPAGDMADGLKSALSKLLATDDPGAMIRDAFDSAAASDPSGPDVTYSGDIEPWLGQRAGFFLSGYDPNADEVTGAGVIAVTDAGAAQSFIDKLAEADSAGETDESYNGVDYKLDESGTAVGIDGDFLIVGTEQSFKDAVDAGEGDSFADNSDASSALEAAPGDSLFSLYADTPVIVDLIKSSSGFTADQAKQLDAQLAQYSQGPIVAWGSATDSTLALGTSTPTQEGGSGPSDLIASFPADAWLAFSAAGFGDQLQQQIDQFSSAFQSGFGSSAPPGVDSSADDPLKQFEQGTGIDLTADLAWIGDVGGFVEGTSLLGIGAGLELEATDQDAASATLDKLKSALEGNGQIQITPSSSGDGFKVQPVGSPVGAEIALRDGKVVAAVGAASVDDVVSPSESLDGSDRFNAAKDALGDGLSPSFFLDFEPIISLVKSSGQVTEDPQYQAAEPYLSALDYLVTGSKVDGDRATGSLVLGVKEGTSTAGTTPAAITP